MNISLTPELERLVSEKVGSGMYGSASEVVREALRLLCERDQLRELRREQLRQQIAQGMADLDAGRVEDFSDDLAAELKKQGRSTIHDQ